MNSNLASTVSSPHPHSQANSRLLKFPDRSPISNTPNVDSLVIMPENESHRELKMNEWVKGILATVLAGIILGSLGWANLNINSLIVSVNESTATGALRWQSIEQKFQSIDRQMWSMTDAQNSEKILELRFKIFEDRLSTLEEERSEYLNLLRSLTYENVRTTEIQPTKSQSARSKQQGPNR